VLDAAGLFLEPARVLLGPPVGQGTAAPKLAPLVVKPVRDFVPARTPYSETTAHTERYMLPHPTQRDTHAIQGWELRKKTRGASPRLHYRLLTLWVAY